MTNHFGHKLLGITIVLGLAAGALGCVDTNTAIFIRQVQAPDTANQCVVTADPSALHRTRGFIDSALLVRPYAASVLVGNQLVRRGDNDTLRPESARVQLFTAEVEVFDHNGGTLSEFSQPISGFIDPSNGTEPSYGLTSLVLVDAGTVGGANGIVVARVKIFGETLGGDDVETGYWDYPVEVCSGCLGCIEPKTCDDEIVAVCNFGQDSAVDCRCINQGACCIGNACENIRCG